MGSGMKIAPGTVVTLAYDVTDASGEIIESSEISGPVTFMHGNQAILPGLGKRLTGMVEGQEATFEFPPQEAFGTVDSAPTKSLTRADFPKNVPIVVGSEFEASVGGGNTVKLRVAEVATDNVTVQMIHPLAGQTIGMSVKILGIREATAAEKEAGRAISKPPPPPPKG
jgi:FKBP-type peptidyl-prolyl cis-trans isomerase SlyD